MGAASRGGIDLVLFCSGVSEVVIPLEVPFFLLLGPLGLVRMDLLGVCCEVAGAVFSACRPFARDCGNEIE